SHGVAGDAQAAVGTVLEAHRQLQPTDHFPVNLRFTGARTDGGPAQQIVEVAGRQRLQQFAGDRQAGSQDVQHQLARQAQPFGHVAAAIEVRIVEQAFPADGSARLLDISAHHQQQLIADLWRERGQALGVFQRGNGVMQGAGSDHDQQAWIATIEHGANGVAIVVDAFGECGAQRQALAQQGGAWQRLGAAANGSSDGRRNRLGDGELDGDVLSVGGSIHDLAVPSAGAGDPATALIECSFGWCQGSGEAAKSPVVTVITVGAVSAHGVFLVLWPFFRPKNKNPGRVADRGCENCSGGDPACSGACGVSGAPVAKPIPEEVIADCRDFLATQRRGAQGTGVDGEQGSVAKGHVQLLNANNLNVSQRTLQAIGLRLRLSERRAELVRPRAARNMVDQMAEQVRPYRLITSTKRGVASLSMRRFWKSNSLRSASCEGTTFCNARNMISVRPGDLRSHSCSISLTTWRCRFSCEPQRLHGMMGNSFICE